MAKTITLNVGHTYALSTASGCTVTDADGVQVTAVAAGTQGYFTAQTPENTLSDDDARLTLVFKAAPGGGSGGGFIESDLRIGHGAADAVKAVCMLTLGEPTEEGTLVDNSTPVAASASVTPLESYAAETTYIMGIGDAGNTYGGFTWTPGEAGTPSDFVDALNTLGNWGTGPATPMETPLVHAELDEDTGKVVLTIVDENWLGTDGNRLMVKEFSENLPISDEVPVSFSGGKDRRTLHLDAAPATYAHDFWPMTHPTAGGVLVVGDHTFAEVEEKAAANAYGYWPNEAGSYSSPPIELRRLADQENPAGEYEVLWVDNGGFNTPEEFIAAFNSEQDAAEAEISELEDTPFLITAKGDYAGAEGNRLVLANNSGGFYVTQLTGGQDARTLEEALELAVSTINDDEDSPIRAEVGEDAQGNKGIAVYALEAGSGHDYDCTQTTGQFFQVSIDWDSDGQDARTLDEVAAAITAEGSDFADEVVVTHASGASTLTLTAATAGKAANAIVYTSTGCFGGETVKQGSTTRGKDAVAQTAFKIYLNGEELDVEPAPLPTALTPTTAMRNGGVYTVEAAYEATTLSLPPNATAEIWVRIGATAFNVSLPDSWVWVNGAASDMTGKTNTTFCIAVRNDGVKVLASIAYSYDTTPAQS